LAANEPPHVQRNPAAARGRLPGAIPPGRTRRRESSPPPPPPPCQAPRRNAPPRWLVAASGRGRPPSRGLPAAAAPSRAANSSAHRACAEPGPPRDAAGRWLDSSRRSAREQGRTAAPAGTAAARGSRRGLRAQSRSEHTPKGKESTAGFTVTFTRAVRRFYEGPTQGRQFSRSGCERPRTDVVPKRRHAGPGRWQTGARAPQVQTPPLELASGASSGAMLAACESSEAGSPGKCQSDRGLSVRARPADDDSTTSGEAARGTGHFKTVHGRARRPRPSAPAHFASAFYERFSRSRYTIAFYDRVSGQKYGRVLRSRFTIAFHGRTRRSRRSTAARTCS
jgi:hypothetical protein